MPRGARSVSSTGIYHVMMRGADGRTLFADDADCGYFLKILKRIKIEERFKLFAYCLMGNHVHLLMKEENETIGESIKRLGTSYAYYFNKKYERHGHLFQDRFRSERVEDDAYFLDVLRYICQNPVKAGLSRTPKEYPWLGCSGVKDAAGITDPMGLLTDLAGPELMDFVNTPVGAEHLEDNGYKRLTEREALKFLKNSVGCDDPEQMREWGRKHRAEAIRAALVSGISIRQLSQITGISTSTIARISRGMK